MFLRCFVAETSQKPKFWAIVWLQLFRPGRQKLREYKKKQNTKNTAWEKMMVLQDLELFFWCCPHFVSNIGFYVFFVCFFVFFFVLCVFFVFWFWVFPLNLCGPGLNNWSETIGQNLGFVARCLKRRFNCFSRVMYMSCLLLFMLECVSNWAPKGNSFNLHKG